MDAALPIGAPSPPIAPAGAAPCAEGEGGFAEALTRSLAAGDASTAAAPVAPSTVVVAAASAQMPEITIAAPIPVPIEEAAVMPVPLVELPVADVIPELDEATRGPEPAEEDQLPIPPELKPAETTQLLPLPTGIPVPASAPPMPPRMPAAAPPESDEEATDPDTIPVIAMPVIVSAAATPAEPIAQATSAPAPQAARPLASRVKEETMSESSAAPVPELPEVPAVAIPAPQRTAPSLTSALWQAEALGAPTAEIAAYQGAAARPVLAEASPLASASPSPPPPPARQVASVAIALAFTPGPSNGFDLSLEPPELGRVQIRVQREGDSHSVRVTAERPETLALLQRDRHELDRNLAEAGLRVDAGGIDFSLETHGGDARPGQHDSARGDDRRGGHSGGTSRMPVAEAPPPRVMRSLLDLNI
ncbi:MAG: hypothetical protein JWR10_1487 [Rubritepida sp.]|nr:hypothetical protein [Rubritepida sp.]